MSVPIEIDEQDANNVNDAWIGMLDIKQKRMLMWYFVRRSPPEFICKRLGIRRHPASVFDLELWRACDAINKLLDRTAQRNKIHATT